MASTCPGWARSVESNSWTPVSMLMVRVYWITPARNEECQLQASWTIDYYRSTPTLKELQGHKVRLKLPLLGAPIPPNLMRFRCTVMEKCRQNISKHTCMHDDLYLPCIFAWGQSQTLITPKLKELQMSKSRCKQLLLAATTTPNFDVFCCMVPKKWHQTLPHTGRQP